MTAHPHHVPRRDLGGVSTRRVCRPPLLEKSRVMTAEQADGSNYRDDSKSIDESAEGSNYRDDDKANEDGELADGSNLRDDSKRISKVADGSNYREPPP